MIQFGPQSKGGQVAGYPACVYGFFMYLIIACIGLAGRVAGRRG